MSQSQSYIFTLQSFLQQIDGLNQGQTNKIVIQLIIQKMLFINDRENLAMVTYENIPVNKGGQNDILLLILERGNLNNQGHVAIRCNNLIVGLFFVDGWRQLNQVYRKELLDPFEGNLCQRLILHYNIKYDRKQIHQQKAFVYFIGGKIMLVHLKPKKSRENEVMENYAQVTNWKYRTANPIHCKNNKNPKGLQNYLTQTVSIEGRKSISPENFEDPFKQFDMKKAKEKEAEEKAKKVEEAKKNTLLQISTLYKKTFKYNTTIYQILRNLNRSSQSKEKATTNRKFSQSKFKQKDNKSFSLKSEQAIESQFPSQQLQRKHIFTNSKIKYLEQIQSKCQPLQHDNFPDNVPYHTNELKFLGEKESSVRNSLFQFRISRPNHIKVQWKREQKRKRNQLRNKNKTLEPTSLQTISQEMVDSLFHPLNSSRQLYSFDKYQKQKYDKPASNMKSDTKYQKGSIKCNTDRSENIRRGKQYSTQSKFLHHKKFVSRLKHISQVDFAVEAWRTKDKDQNEFNLQTYS